MASKFASLHEGFYAVEDSISTTPAVFEVFENTPAEFDAINFHVDDAIMLHVVDQVKLGNWCSKRELEGRGYAHLNDLFVKLCRR